MTTTTPVGRKHAKYFVALAVAVVSFIFWWATTHRSTSQSAAVGRISEQIPESYSVTRDGTSGAPREKPAGTTQPLPTAPPATGSEPAIKRSEHWEQVARATRLRLMLSSDFSLTPAAVALLELTPEKSEAMSQELRKFVTHLGAAEVENAHVLVKNDGSEEIVVWPFDRGPLVKAFRDSVAATFGSDMAGFIAEQMRYDSTLAIEPKEMRLYIEKGDDGLDRVVFERFVRQRDATDGPHRTVPGKPPKLPTIKNVDKLLVRGEFDIRYRGLFRAAPNLPRVREAK